MSQAPLERPRCPEPPARRPLWPARVLVFWLATLASLVWLSGCAGQDRMNGFTEREAAASATAPSVVSACDVRRGRLVLEIERALVREYPRSAKDAIGDKKQPLILLWVAHRDGGRGAEAITPLVAPEEYGPGDRIRFFDGRRMLDLPARLLEGRMLDVRLAENNRTAEPGWRRAASAVGHGVVGAAGEVGVATPSAGIVDLALEQLNRLDRDDLVLRWSASAEQVMASLGSPSERRALRYALTTGRVVASGPGKGLPAAELDLLFFWEPEPGCSWDPPRP